MEKLEGKKVILKDEAQNCVKRLELFFHPELHQWKFVTHLLDRDTLEHTKFVSNSITHQSMCWLIRLFFEITENELDSEKYNGE
jgi:hypothetical protein